MRFALLVALLGACYQPAPPAGVACAANEHCPSGQTCVTGTCLDDDEVDRACAGMPDGTPCGNTSASDCDAPDTCLANACVANRAAAGAACYDCAAGPGLCLACTAGICDEAACTPGAGAPIPAELASAIVGSNGDEGNMFDVVATETITITSFETYSTDTGMTEYEIYTKPGTHVGAEMAAAQWTRVGGATFLLAGAGVYSPIPIPIEITIPAGERRAFYLTNKTLNNRYHNGTAVGAVLAQTPELTLYEGTGNNYAMTGFDTFNMPRAWEGKIHYRTGGGTTLATAQTGTIASDGVMFDVEAKTDLEVTMLGAHLAPGNHDVEIYFKRGSYAGAETAAAAWRRAAMFAGVTSAGANVPTELVLASPVYLAAGETTAFCVTTSGQLRTTLGTAGASAADSADATIRAGVTITGAFGQAGSGASPNVSLGFGRCD